MLLEVKAVPRQNAFGLSYRNGWRVTLVSAPEKGEANREIESGLAKLLSCDVRVVRGFTSRRKVLEVALDEGEFRKRTESIVQGQKASGRA